MKELKYNYWSFMTAAKEIDNSNSPFPPRIHNLILSWNPFPCCTMNVHHWTRKEFSYFMSSS